MRATNGLPPGATIELLIDGFYVVIHQEHGWPRRIVGPEIDGPHPVAMGP